MHTSVFGADEAAPADDAPAQEKQSIKKAASKLRRKGKLDKETKKQMKKAAKEEKVRQREDQMAALKSLEGEYPEENDPNLLTHSQRSWRRRKEIALGPKPLEESKLIRREQLKEMVDDGSASELVILDLREAVECQYEPPIPHARNLPFNSLADGIQLNDVRWQTRHQFPKPKTTDDIIVYSSPERYADSVNAVRLLERAGYPKVRALVNGQREWNKYYNPALAPSS